MALILKKGGIGVMPTDTIYGIVGSALDRATVERIYAIRRRNPKKPLIILIGSMRDLRRFGIRPDRKSAAIFRKLWPGKVSIILPCRNKKFTYLHRGTKSLAFRLPAKRSLRNLLKRTGPLVAPSANWEGHPPARTIAQAKRYFGKGVDFYVGTGLLDSPPSTLVAIRRGRVIVLRPGAVAIPNS